MRKEKYIRRVFIGVLGLIIVALTTIYFLEVNSNKKLEKDHEELENSYYNLKNDYTLLADSFDQTKDQNVSKECTFVRTYKVVDLVSGIKSQDGNSYVVLNSYQMEPIIYPLGKYKMYVGKTYEFTLKGNTKNGNAIDYALNNYEVIDVKQTTKTGLEQLNEVCK